MLLTALLLAASLASSSLQDAPVKVVTSLTTYGAIAREIVGDRGTVRSIAQGDEDPHFVQPKPSFVALLRDADLFVTTGMDLELWVPTLLDRANNRDVAIGGRGYVTAYTGVDLLEVPATVSRAEGDIHAAGNPHIHTDPLNAILIARNILRGLERVAPEDAEYFRTREADFERRVLEATMGAAIVGILTSETAVNLLRTNQLIPFLTRTSGCTSTGGTGSLASSISSRSPAFRPRRGTSKPSYGSCGNGTSSSSWRPTTSAAPKSGWSPNEPEPRLLSSRKTRTAPPE